MSSAVATYLFSRIRWSCANYWDQHGRCSRDGSLGYLGQAGRGAVPSSQPEGSQQGKDKDEPCAEDSLQGHRRHLLRRSQSELSTKRTTILRDTDSLSIRGYCEWLSLYRNPKSWNREAFNGPGASMSGLCRAGCPSGVLRQKETQINGDRTAVPRLFLTFHRPLEVNEGNILMTSEKPRGPWTLHNWCLTLGPIPGIVIVYS